MFLLTVMRSHVDSMASIQSKLSRHCDHVYVYVFIPIQLNIRICTLDILTLCSHFLIQTHKHAHTHINTYIQRPCPIDPFTEEPIKTCKLPISDRSNNVEKAVFPVPHMFKCTYSKVREVMTNTCNECNDGIQPLNAPSSWVSAKKAQQGCS
jgi:hypothetical protein